MTDSIFAKRGRTVGDRGRPAAKHPLSGIGRCGVCGGSIGGAGNRLSNGRRITSYACLRHHTRGSTVCPVSVYQSSREVEEGLLGYLQENVLTPPMIDSVVAEIRERAQQELSASTDDVQRLRKELRQVQAEVKRLAKAVAILDDGRELLSEVRQRQARIRWLETRLAAAGQTATTTAGLISEIVATAEQKLSCLHAAVLDDREGLRELFLSLFPDGLTFKPAKILNRQVWAISGAAMIADASHGRLMALLDLECYSEAQTVSKSSPTSPAALTRSTNRSLT